MIPAFVVLKYANKILSQNPKNIGALVLRGDSYVHLGEYDKAVDSYLEALSINGANPAIHYKLARIYSMQGKVDLAISFLETALNIAPDQTIFLTSLAEVLVLANRPLEAMLYARVALAIAPQNAKTQELVADLDTLLSELDVPQAEITPLV